MQARPLGDRPVGRRGAAGPWLLAAALLGSLLLLGSMARTGIHRAQRVRAAQQPVPGPRPEDQDAEDVIPVLDDVVGQEELERGPAQPPVLTDEVLPGRRGR